MHITVIIIVIKRIFLLAQCIRQKKLTNQNFLFHGKKGNERP